MFLLIQISHILFMLMQIYFQMMVRFKLQFSFKFLCFSGLYRISSVVAYRCSL